jgi:hypothetical protein
MNTESGLPVDHYLLLDNSELTPDAAAQRIIDHFDLA